MKDNVKKPPMGGMGPGRMGARKSCRKSKRF